MANLLEDRICRRLIQPGFILAHGQSAVYLFVLVAETGIDYVSVIISPVDFRVQDVPVSASAGPEWISELYQQIREWLHSFERRDDP